jgi:hypothetical protein
MEQDVYEGEIDLLYFFPIMNPLFDFPPRGENFYLVYNNLTISEYFLPLGGDVAKRQRG